MSPETKVQAQTNGQSRPLTRKDFVAPVDVRWCPGCGDYSILAQMQRVLPTLGIPRENFVFVSGIGCSSRFPYYMNTYGFHTIHGRAPAVATGLKITRPELSVWVITGDGDGLSIGGNHLIHAMRRNVDINIVLFNNRIYGLTKGQYSPTSERGKITKSSPMGSVEHAFNPISLAVACEATFVARTVDADPKHMQAVFRAAAAHKGVSFIEVFQNCVIFNDGAFSAITDKAHRDERELRLEHGQPMRFGANREKGIRLSGLKPEVVAVGEGGVDEGEILVHDAHTDDPTLALMLSRFEAPAMPVPIGIFRDVESPTYEHDVWEQVRAAKKNAPSDDAAVEALFAGGATWTVEDS